MARRRIPIDIASRDEQFERDVVDQMPFLRRFAMSLCGRASDADDLVQDVVCTALRKHVAFERGTNIKAWLATIMRNDFLSKKRRSSRVVEDPDGVLAAGLRTLPDQEDVVELAEVRRRIEMLPVDMRVALMTVGEMGGAYEEAAEYLGVATGTVKSRVSRARSNLERLGRVIIVDVEDEPEEALSDIDIVRLKKDFTEGGTLSDLTSRYGVPIDEVMRHVAGLKRKAKAPA